LSEKTYGGQAVMEGVMMRGTKGLCIAVRRPDGTISLLKQNPALLSSRWPIFKLPVLRGSAAFVDTLAIGLDALMHSAKESGGEDVELSKGALGLTMFLGIAMAVGLFILLPTVLMRVVLGYVQLNPFVANLAEGSIRISIFFLYIMGVSIIPDMRRFYQYHGAEHKTIYCHEAGQELTLQNARVQSCMHPRCGTAFLLIVMVTSILVFSFFGWPNMLVRVVTRLLLLPLVAGLAYEVIKASAKSKNPIWKLVTVPGLYLQRATTREPDDGQIEVAIAAMRGALDLENELRSQEDA
jgi:uncharacterized protein YqhQ